VSCVTVRSFTVGSIRRDTGKASEPAGTKKPERGSSGCEMIRRVLFVESFLSWSWAFLPGRERPAFTIFLAIFLGDLAPFVLVELAVLVGVVFVDQFLP